jgi:hypothetical protein
MRADQRHQWDIIATASAGPSALWYAAQIATRLAHEHGARVRLFTDSLEEFARAAIGIDANLLQQTWNGVQVLDQRLAAQSAPAHAVLIVFDSVVPGGYAEALGRPPRGVALRLLRLDQTHDSDTLRCRSGAVAVHGLRQGDAGRGLGLVRPAGGLHRADFLPPRQRPVSAPRRGERTVVLAAEADGTWKHWLRAFVGSTMPIHLLVLPYGACEEIRARLPIVAAEGTAELGPLRVTLIDAHAWQTADRLMAECDLVLTSHEDILLRGALFGVPVSYKGWQHCAGTVPPGSLEQRLRNAVEGLNDAWHAGGTGLSHAWNGFCRTWPAAMETAAQTHGTLASMPALEDALASFAMRAWAASPEAAFRPSKAHDFAPTAYSMLA